MFTEQKKISKIVTGKSGAKQKRRSLEMSPGKHGTLSKSDFLTDVK
jgi:hypothetical protein